VWALMPVAGTLDSGGPDAGPFISGLNAHFEAYSMDRPGWITNLMPKRLAYADAHTSVKVFVSVVDHTTIPPTLYFEHHSPYTFGPRDPITVQVTHHLNLSVPYVSMIYSDGSYSTDSHNGRYTTVEAQYTLTNEGVLDELPPTPPLPRTP
jgi:hypothetical protein